MPRTIASVGNVSYNGVTFPSALNTKIQQRIIQQIGGGATKYVTASLTVDTILTYVDSPIESTEVNGVDIGVGMEFVKQRLTQQGKTLTFTDQGWGDVVINAFATPGFVIPNGAKSLVDLAHGPVPKLLVWEPVGSNRAAHVAWMCDFTIPDCVSTSIDGTRGILEISHESSFTINSEGRLTRTVRATIEIASNYDNTGTLTRTADSYAKVFEPLKVEGFHREIHRSVSRDHRVLTITYIDTEIFSDNAYYNGMVSMEVDHDVSSNLEQDGFTRWMNTLSGSVRWARGVPPSVAWASVSHLIMQRFSKKQSAPIYSTDTTLKEVTKANIPASLSISESLFDRELSFSFSWYGIANLKDIINKSSLFTPIEGVSWKQWHASIIPVQDPYGPLGLKEKNTDVSKVELCGNQSVKVPNNEITKPTYSLGTTPFNFGCGNIPKGASWLVPGNYTIQVMEKGNIVPQFPSSGPSPGISTSKPVSKGPEDAGLSGSQMSESTPTNAIKYQQSTYNQAKIRVTGRIVRVCYEPYNPVFTHYGDVPLYLYSNNDKVHKVDGQFFPIYYLQIDREYHLSKIPDGSPVLKIKTDANKGDR